MSPMLRPRNPITMPQTSANLKNLTITPRWSTDRKSPTTMPSVSSKPQYGVCPSRLSADAHDRRFHPDEACQTTTYSWMATKNRMPIGMKVMRISLPSLKGASLSRRSKPSRSGIAFTQRRQRKIRFDDIASKALPYRPKRNTGASHGRNEPFLDKTFCCSQKDVQERAPARSMDYPFIDCAVL